MQWWLFAWEHYTPFAVAAKQLALAACLDHRKVVMEVAARAGVKRQGVERTEFLAVLYDELARQSI